MTTDLRNRSHPEVAVVVDWPPDAAADIAVEALLRDIAGYLHRTGRSAEAGQTMQYGWSTLRFAAPSEREPLLPDDILVMEEMADPFGDLSKGYRPGVRSTVHIQVSQDTVLERHRLADRGEAPSSDSRALICQRLVHEPMDHRTLTAMRWPPDKPGAESPWQIGCTDDDHDHDDKQNWGVGHIGHIAATHPFLLQYLALPGDTALDVGETWVVVFVPGAEEGEAEPGDPLSWRP